MIPQTRPNPRAFARDYKAPEINRLAVERSFGGPVNARRGTRGEWSLFKGYKNTGNNFDEVAAARVRAQKEAEELGAGFFARPEKKAVNL